MPNAMAASPIAVNITRCHSGLILFFSMLPRHEPTTMVATFVMVPIILASVLFCFGPFGPFLHAKL
jgi:hypothetical protein